MNSGLNKYSRGRGGNLSTSAVNTAKEYTSRNPLDPPAGSQLPIGTGIIGLFHR